jgi:hypothetical protein
VRQVEHAGDRVVDLVGDARRELTERGLTIALDQPLLRRQELSPSLLDRALEAAGDRVEVIARA